MKRIFRLILKILRACLLTIIGIFVGNLIGLTILWYIKCGSAPQDSIKPDEKKLLFHFFGIENMTPEEKTDILKRSPDFMDNYKGEIDSALINKIFPNQVPAYNVDSQFVINFHLTNGNPGIKIGYVADFQDYFNPMWGISLSPFSCLDKKPAKIWLNSYFTELAHAKQFYQNPFDFEFTFFVGLSEAIFLSMITDKTVGEAYRNQYNEDGSFEHEAHEKIDPQFVETYLNYRSTLFKDKISKIEEKLEKKKKKHFKAGKYASEDHWDSKEHERKYQLMWATRDSLVYGPLFLH